PVADRTGTATGRRSRLAAHPAFNIGSLCPRDTPAGLAPPCPDLRHGRFRTSGRHPVSGDQLVLTMTDDSPNHPDRNEDGFLCNPDDWTPAVAGMLAAEDGITLSPAHAEIITLARRYFT